MMTLEEENMQAVYEHIRNVPLDLSDFDSLHFSTNSSSFDTLNTSQIVDAASPERQAEEDNNQMSGANPECPFDEFNS